MKSHTFSIFLLILVLTLLCLTNGCNTLLSSLGLRGGKTAAKSRSKVEVKDKDKSKNTPKKKYEIPKKLTLGFMAKTFFVTMVDPSIGAGEVSKEKTDSSGKKITGKWMNLTAVVYCKALGHTDNHTSPLIVGKRHKLGDIAAGGMFTGGTPSFGMVCGPNGCH